MNRIRRNIGLEKEKRINCLAPFLHVVESEKKVRNFLRYVFLLTCYKIMIDERRDDMI